jgi:hypothetical protein
VVSWLILNIAFFTFMASVQNRRSPPEPSTYLLVLPVPAMPISFEQVEQRSRRLKGGASSFEITVRSVHRDSDGRLRIERGASERPSAALSGVILIIDPVAWMMLVSTESEKVGYRLPLLKSSAVRFTNFCLAADDDAASGKWISRTEQLGTQKIEGLEFEGTRIVQTSGDGLRIIKSVEQWHSARLNLIGSVVVATPDETYAVRIQDVRREEPDPALFKIPPGYRILDMLDR